MVFGRALLAAPFLFVLAACGTASGVAESDNSAVAAPVTTNAVAVEPVSNPTAFKLGTNLSTINYWDGTRPFMNVIYGSSWQMAPQSGAAIDVPKEDLDSLGWVKSVPAGYRVMRMLSIPNATGDFVCHYQGSGQLSVGGPVSNISYAAGETRFRYTSSYPSVTWAHLEYNVDPTNYIRNIDCREASASSTAVFGPELLSNLSGFKVIRFIKWQPAVEANTSATWASRNKPGDGDYGSSDGVPVEVMVNLANQVGANPWFNMPWNADDDYITRFATYVRDNLASDKQVYVETSNEVWNWGYAVTTQASNEGAAEGLPSDVGGRFQQALERYAEKTQHVMQIWATVFAGQSNRLVRVGSFQNAQPFWVNYTLGYNNLANSIDAVATAPYFGGFIDVDFPVGAGVDEYLNTLLPAKMTETLDLALQNKQIATRYGKRYVSYEGGQHVVMRDASKVAMLQQIQRDPRMYDIYKRYISTWQSQIGDTLNMFALAGPISSFGAWGMTEYLGQPLTETPKLRAVRDFLGVATASAETVVPVPVPAPAPTQVCPNGSVILATSTCPSTSTSTPTPVPTTGKGRTKNARRA